MLTLARLDELLNRMPGLTIGLLGDLFLDRYMEIEPSLDESSIETDLVAYQVTGVRNSPGALGTVMNNLAALGVGRLAPVTVVGDDGHGYDLRKALKPLPVDLTGLISDPERLTPTYTKPMRGGAELNRLDVRTRQPLASASEDELVRRLTDVFEQADGLIVLDQVVESNLGVVNERVRAALQSLASSNPEKLIFVDSRSHLGAFACGSLKGNRSEVLGAAEPASDNVEAAAAKLASKTGRSAFVTQGEEGILVADPSGETFSCPAVAVEGPVDIVGAGDSATAAIVGSLLSGATLCEAAQLANLAASITIKKLGTTGAATPEEIRLKLTS